MIKFKDLPIKKPFRLSGNDLTVFKITENKTVNIWFRDLQQFITMPNSLMGGFINKLKASNYELINRLPK